MKTPERKQTHLPAGEVEQRLDALESDLLDLFVDGKVDFEKLQHALDFSGTQDPETYTFSWPGKLEARASAQEAPGGVLLPVLRESFQFPVARHLFIEGENLEVLKILRTTHSGKIRLILLDPPGSLEGKPPLSAVEPMMTAPNSPAWEGRGHAGDGAVVNWLSAMFSRLLVARDLLTEDGFIFIRSDDRDLPLWRMLLDEVLGRGCLQNSFVIRAPEVASENGKSSEEPGTHEFLLAFSRRPEARLGKVKVPRERAAGSKTLANVPAGDVWLDLPRGNDEELTRLLGVVPRPGMLSTALIKRVLQVSTLPGEDHQVLDFFTCGASVAHAVVELNHRDGGNRRFIMIQPPKIGRAGVAGNLIELGRDRIRKVISALQQGRGGEKHEAHEAPVQASVGFQVLKLAFSKGK